MTFLLKTEMPASIEIINCRNYWRKVNRTLSLIQNPHETSDYMFNINKLNNMPVLIPVL